MSFTDNAELPNICPFCLSALNPISKQTESEPNHIYRFKERDFIMSSER